MRSAGLWGFSENKKKPRLAERHRKPGPACQPGRVPLQARGPPISGGAWNPRAPAICDPGVPDCQCPMLARAPGGGHGDRAAGGGCRPRRAIPGLRPKPSPAGRPPHPQEAARRRSPHHATSRSDSDGSQPESASEMEHASTEAQCNANDAKAGARRGRPAMSKSEGISGLGAGPHVRPASERPSAATHRMKGLPSSPASPPAHLTRTPSRMRARCTGRGGRRARPASAAAALLLPSLPGQARCHSTESEPSDIDAMRKGARDGTIGEWEARRTAIALASLSNVHARRAGHN